MHILVPTDTCRSHAWHICEPAWSQNPCRASSFVCAKLGLRNSAKIRILFIGMWCVSAAAAAIGVIGMTENALQPSAHATGNHQNVDRQLQMHARTMEPPLVTHRSPRSSRKGCRALCIGLGGGSLPNFLSHHFPGLLVDAVELDPLVVTAATDYMGFPSHRCFPPSPPLLTPFMLHAL